jgi:hypothetical protein
VVQQYVLQVLLGRLLVVFGDLLESLVCGGEDGVVGLGAVEGLDEVIVFIDELRKLGSVLALVNELHLC